MTQVPAPLTDEEIARIADEEAINYVTDERRPDDATVSSFARSIAYLRDKQWFDMLSKAEPVAWAMRRADGLVPDVPIEDEK